MVRLLAFHGDTQLKADLLAEIIKHRKQDQIVKGSYGRENGVWKGCAVGCSIHSLNQVRGLELDTSQHAAYESGFGIPRILARLEDGIFESLPDDLHLTWPERFISATPVNADLSLVWPQFAHWMLVDQEFGVIQFTKRENTRKAITDIADKYQRWAQTGANPLKYGDWMKLRRDAAYAAAAYAADAAAAAAAYAAYAAAAAAYAADAAAAAAAYAAAYAADAAAAAIRGKWRVAQSEKLLELMAAALVV
jgi:hypothetical protein